MRSAGSSLIGLALAHLAAKPDLSSLWRLFFVTGFLGALTTFSSFSAEVIVLVQGGRRRAKVALAAAMHLVASLALTALDSLFTGSSPDIFQQSEVRHGTRNPVSTRPVRRTS